MVAQMQQQPPQLPIDTILHGDSLEVLQSLPDAYVDAIVTDPPWMPYTTGRYDASAWHEPVDYLSPDRYAHLLYRVLRDQSALILWCRWDCFQSHSDALQRVGFRVRNCIVWAKPNHTAGDLNGNIGNKHEMAVFATKGKWKRHSKREVNLWVEPHLFSRAKRIHPTEKPVGLMARAVRLACPPGGLVLDPFAGSGSTLEAAKLEGRRYLGVEREARYVAQARKRLDTAAPHLVLLPQPQPEQPVRIVPRTLWEVSA